jgi:hypothetical protein
MCRDLIDWEELAKKCLGSEHGVEMSGGEHVAHDFAVLFHDHLHPIYDDRCKVTALGEQPGFSIR